MHISHEFAPRARHCIFLGYPVGQKANKLFDLTTHQMFTSRDVVFHETIFPYESIPPTSSTSVPVLPLSVSDTSQPDPIPPVPQSPPVPKTVSSQPPLVVDPYPEPPLRRSHRPHHPPPALRDYICNQVTFPTICQLCPLIHNKVRDILFAILSLIIVTHHSITHSLLLSVKTLNLKAMPKQLLIPIGKKLCSLNWPL